MLSLIEVKCPHCGAQGQIMLPPLGAIIVGPCPECEGMVVVFCGRVMPLDKEVITEGTALEKKEHLLDVLTVFLEERVERLFANQEEEAEEEQEVDSSVEETEEEEEEDDDTLPVVQTEGPLISTEEFQSFLNEELRLIDDKNYFRAIFQ